MTGDREYVNIPGNEMHELPPLLVRRASGAPDVDLASAILPFGGTWSIDISPAPEGSVVRITEDGQIHNVIFRFMARFFFGYTASIEGCLRDLGRRFGEFTTIEP